MSTKINIHLSIFVKFLLFYVVLRLFFRFFLSYLLTFPWFPCILIIEVLDIFYPALLQPYLSFAARFRYSEVPMTIDLHTHTIASGHGSSDTITDLAKEASRRHMAVLGISDHAPAMIGAAHASYFRSLSHAERSRFGVRLLYGAELNIRSVSGSVDLDDSILSSLDYAIASLHSPLFPAASAAEHTQAYINAMKSPLISIIGHPDDTHFPILVPDLVSAAKQYHTLLEINNSSLSPDGYRGYCRTIDHAILSLCMEQEIPVIIGSDSHGIAHIGEDQYARALMQELGFPDRLIVNGNPALLFSYLHVH